MENCSMNQIDITGCRISLYPMKDDFASHILRSIKETDTTAVWQQTDLFSTLYRGEAASVIDAAAALFVNAYDPKTHLVGEFTFSKGCPGDLAGDAFLSGKHERPNHQQITAKGTFIVQCNILFMSLDVKIIWKKLRISSRWRMPWAYNRNRPIT